VLKIRVSVNYCGFCGISGWYRIQAQAPVAENIPNVINRKTTKEAINLFILYLLICDVTTKLILAQRYEEFNIFHINKQICTNLAIVKLFK
jgi:hypothetical protein